MTGPMIPLDQLKLGTHARIAAIDWAARHGIARLTASLLWGNAAMLNLIRSTGHPLSFGASGAGTLEATIDLSAASAALRAA